MKRSLYQCYNAKVKGDEIACNEGHPLSGKVKGGVIGIRKLMRGSPLEIAIYQKCLDYDEIGSPVSMRDRGWTGNL